MKINLIKKNSLNEIRIDLLFIWVYLFGIVDLFLTYYIQKNVLGSVELSPLFVFGGWSVLVLFKFFLPILFYYLSKKYNDLTLFYVLLIFNIWVDFNNLLVLLNTL